MNAFSDFIGHEAVVSRLRSLILANKLPHAIILDGDGKSTLARIVAKSLLCERGGDGSPCGRCLSCITFDSGNNPDIYYVETAKARLGVEDIREQIVKNMEYGPYSYDCKVFIIKDADAATAAAQNALLKTIEEPRPYGRFILLSSNISGFLQTVLSRCVTFSLKPLRDSDVTAFLKNRGYDKAVSESAASVARGSIGKALAFCEDETSLKLRRTVFDILSEAATRFNDPVFAFASAAALMAYKDRINEILDMAEVWCRDVLVLVCTREPRLLLPECREDLEAAARRLKQNHMLNLLNGIEDARFSLRFNGNVSMTVEALMLGVCGYYADN